MDFSSFVLRIWFCSEIASQVYKYLLSSDNLEIARLMVGVDSPGESFCFRIPVGSHRFTHLNVSIPPGAMGNRGPPQDDSSVPTCIETALVGPDGDLVYISGLGYEDICRFYGKKTCMDAIPELEAEILRLLPYARGEKEIPEECPGTGPMDVVP